MQKTPKALQFLDRTGIVPKLGYSKENHPETVIYIWRTAGNRLVKWEIDDWNLSKVSLDNMVMIQNASFLHAVGYMQSRPRTFLTQEPV